MSAVRSPPRLGRRLHGPGWLPRIPQEPAPRTRTPVPRNPRRTANTRVGLLGIAPQNPLRTAHAAASATGRSPERLPGPRLSGDCGDRKTTWGQLRSVSRRRAPARPTPAGRGPAARPRWGPCCSPYRGCSAPCLHCTRDCDQARTHISRPSVITTGARGGPFFVGGVSGPRQRRPYSTIYCGVLCYIKRVGTDPPPSRTPFPVPPPARRPRSAGRVNRRSPVRARAPRHAGRPRGAVISDLKSQIIGVTMVTVNDAGRRAPRLAARAAARSGAPATCSSPADGC